MQRGDVQLKKDIVELEERIQQIRSEINEIEGTLLDKIIMINMSDLSKI